MLTRRQQWQIAIATIEALYEGELDYPLSESAYIYFEMLIFNPKKPVNEEVTKLILETYNLIYLNGKRN